ncbi:MAG: transporter substrate-binding domain-containing protein, partial [Thermodesulfobacteriota bacterium]|nr:transporter substrate-binding domain-containing protein [Thermodesulfobacteriota bacterium]
MKFRRCLMALVAVVLAVSLVSVVSAGTLDDIAKRGELRVACQTQGPPFSFIDKNGERSGSSVEFCQLMAKEMGVKVKFLNYDWDGLIPALLSKKADMLAADMTPTLKRAMKIAFST